MSESIYALVVVYNKACDDSLTCAALKQMDLPEISVLVYDNSTRDYGNREYCQERNWTYLGGDGNKGLSIAYNEAIDHIQASGGTGWLCLFDDDTQISGEYFAELRKAIQPDSRILVPLIYSDGVLISPSRINSHHTITLFADEQAAFAYRGADLTAINSGMAICLCVFEDYRYDAHIFLDGVDHTFLKDMAARGITAEPFCYRCDHRFSGNEKPSKEAALTRFRIYARDYAYIYRDRKPVYRYLAGKRAVKLTVQYQTLQFLKVFFSNGLKE